MLGFLVNRANRVPELQREFLKPSKYPLFLRTPRQRAIVSGYLLFIGGMLAFDCYGAYGLITGTNNIKK